ncbi:MAG: LamG domain-containing protein [Sphingobacteriales bacterium]
MFACKKVDKPALGSYPPDITLPGGPLRFYTSFDGNKGPFPRYDVGDSISGYPAIVDDFTTITGVTGNAVQGAAGAQLYYLDANDFVTTAQSFTVAFWEKRNGMPNGEAEFIFSISSSNGYWAGTSMMLFFDHAGAGATNDLAVLKFLLVDKTVSDAWLTWEGGNKISGIQDNKWHHLVFAYDATTSKLTLYVDGVANANVPQWGSHGGVNLDASKVTSLKIGTRPKEDLGWGRSWTGGLDQFRLYNKALTASEVLALFNSKL